MEKAEILTMEVQYFLSDNFPASAQKIAELRMTIETAITANQELLKVISYMETLQKKKTSLLN